MKEYEEELYDNEKPAEEEEIEEDDENLVREHGFQRGYEEEVEDPSEEKAVADNDEY